MKKFILSLAAVIVFTASYSQADHTKLPALGIHLVLNDFQTAADIRAKGLSGVLQDRLWHKTSRMITGIGFSYIKGISNHVDFAGTLTGSFLDYPVPNRAAQNQQYLLLEAAATGNLKLVSDKYWFNPFLTLGVGASKYKGYYGAFIPAGVGIQIRILDNVFGLINSQYRIPVTDNVAYHFYHSFGIAASIKKKPEPIVVPPPPPPVVVLDRDGDGVLDKDDKCPDTPGLAALQGCPDRDGDGIADGDDKCPDVKGIAKYQGCPIPDTDGDGINDEQDKCPTVKGLARYQGCPIPDTDNDGVNDEEDKCPTRPGPASNSGCPEIKKEVIEKINFAAKNIFFATGSAKLLPKSFKSLDAVVTLMKDDETLLMAIDGHTDITGKLDKNMILSDARANSVKDYLVSKGVAVSRLTATGYGPNKPKADNKTAAGRAQNRRVEMTVRNY